MGAWEKKNQPEEWEGELKRLGVQIVVEPEGEQGEPPEYFKFFVYRLSTDLSDSEDEDILIAKGEMAMTLLKDIDKIQSSLADDDEDDEDDDEDDEEEDDEEEDDD